MIITRHADGTVTSTGKPIVPEKKWETFDLPEYSGGHEIGNPKCTQCWSGYPRPCACGGLIHATFGDEMYEGYWLYYRCDMCGTDYEVA